MSLIEQGYDEEKVRAAATASDNYEQLYEQRFNDLTRTGSLNAYNDLDPDQRLVMVYESYLRCDYEGTGAAQLHRVMSLGGDGETEILDVEPVEELPFAELTAIRRPHRLYGYSLVDLTKPLQRLKTALLRSMMDGFIYRSSLIRGSMQRWLKWMTCCRSLRGRSTGLTEILVKRLSICLQIGQALRLSQCCNLLMA